MTERIYYSDVYCARFTAQVLECRESKKGYEILLDRTAFYPEGGGQPGDDGSLTYMDQGEEVKVRVADTHEKGEEIWHYTDAAIPAGSEVQGEINWDKRFGLMQSHSGEHIISGMVHEKYGYENVGFHMGSDCMTIDLSGELTMEELLEIERKANAYIWTDVPVQIRSYTEEEVKAVSYRSKKELHGEVRIVTFPGADVCACCGTHVSHTGEIGLVKILSVVKFRTGVRVELLCGKAAMDYLTETWQQNRITSVALSAKPLETGAAVEKMKTQLLQADYRVMELEGRLFASEADRLKGKGDMVLFTSAMAPDAVRRLAVAVMEDCGGICAVFAGSDEEGYKYAVGKPEADLRQLVKELNQTCSGRGGGKPFFAQGSVGGKREEIVSFFEEKEIGQIMDVL